MIGCNKYKMLSLVNHTGIHYTSYFTESDSVSCLAHFVVLDDPLNPAVVTLYRMAIM